MAGERVDIDDVGEQGARGRVGEFAPRRGRHTVPGVVVNVLLLVRPDHLGLWRIEAEIRV